MSSTQGELDRNNNVFDWLQEDEPLAEAQALTSEESAAARTSAELSNQRKAVRVMPPVHPNDIKSSRSTVAGIDRERKLASDATRAEGASLAKGVSMSGEIESGSGSLQERIIAELREIYDPEIPVNIYDLGLIYGVEVNEGGHVDVTMTLTTPGCPVAQTFPRGNRSSGE